MAFRKACKKRLQTGMLAALALVGGILPSLPVATQAQGLPGLTLCWTGRCPKELNYRLDFGARPNVFDRYRLRIPGSEIKVAVGQLYISYPDYYDGTFDVNDIQVYARGEEIAIQPVEWDRDGRRLIITPAEPIPASTNIEVHLSNVRNPRFGGMFYFNASIQSPGDIPLLRYIGTWVITIG